MKSRNRAKSIVIIVTLIAIISAMTILFTKMFNKQPLAINEVKQFVVKDVTYNLEYTNDKKLNRFVEETLETYYYENKRDLETTLDAKAFISNEHKVITYLLSDTEKVVDSIVINSKNKSVYKLDDIYDDNLAPLANISRDKLANDFNLKYNKNTYLSTTLAKSDYRNLVIFDDKATVYFNIDEVVAVDYDFAEIRNYFTDSFNKVFDNDFTKEIFDVRYIDPSKPMVAVTFDDGPTPNLSEDVAKYFVDHNSNLTFFFLGSRIETQKDYVKQLFDMGVEIANHSYDHPSFNNLSKEELIFQSNGVSDMIREITNQKEVLLRPPYGASNSEVRKQIDSPLIMWSIDPLDWKFRDSAFVVSEISKYLTDGSIVLLHDLYDTSIDAAKTILDKFSDKYQFVSVSELFAYKGIPLENSELYFAGY